MAKKPKFSKTQAVRDYLKDHPGALSSEIAAALNKQGIKITAGYAANIKVALGKPQAINEAAKKQAVTKTAAPATVDKPAKNGDVPRHKPAPDIFLEAARRLDVPPADCQVYEDTNPGIEAAQAAGMAVIDVRGMGSSSK
jgi:HAD superfamily hydrolase (TIGR01509 family)